MDSSCVGAGTSSSIVGVLDHKSGSPSPSAAVASDGAVTDLIGAANSSNAETKASNASVASTTTGSGGGTVASSGGGTVASPSGSVASIQPPDYPPPPPPLTSTSSSSTASTAINSLANSLDIPDVDATQPDEDVVNV